MRNNPGGNSEGKIGETTEATRMVVEEATSDEIMINISNKTEYQKLEESFHEREKDGIALNDFLEKLFNSENLYDKQIYIKTDVSDYELELTLDDIIAESNETSNEDTTTYTLKNTSNKFWREYIGGQYNFKVKDGKLKMCSYTADFKPKESTLISNISIKEY